MCTAHEVYRFVKIYACKKYAPHIATKMAMNYFDDGIRVYIFLVLLKPTKSVFLFCIPVILAIPLLLSVQNST